MDMDLQDILAAEPWATPHRWVFDQLFNDPDFTKPIDALIADMRQDRTPLQIYVQIRQDAATKARIRKLAQELDIKPEFIQRYIEYKLTGLDVRLLDRPTVARRGDNITITLNARTTKDDLIAVWPEVDDMKKQIPNSVRKWKEPENAQLLYAIYKCRRNGDTFQQVFTKYEQGMLPSWAGKPTQFKDQETMERNYRRHKIERMLKVTE